MAVLLPQLGRKFAVLYSLAPRVKCQADLAARMGVATSTVSGWVNGIRSKEGGRVRPEVLSELCDLLCEESKHPLTADQARQLWEGSYDEFRATLTRSLTAPLLTVLKRSPRALPVRHTIIDPRAFGMIEGAIDVPDDAISLGSDRAIAFEIDGKAGMSLVMLVEEPTGWRILAPGTMHSGCIKDRPERVPNNNSLGLKFKPPYGPHRIIFIELPADATAVLPVSGGVAALQARDLDGLAVKLERPQRGMSWRWNEAFLDVFEQVENARRSAR